MILAFVAFSAVILNVRFLEYACPFALLATGAGISAICRYPTGFSRPITIIFSRGRGMVLILALLAFAGTYCLIYFLQDERIFHKVKPLEDLTEWTQKADIPMGTVIGNVNWSDFPVLLYSAPQFRYLLGIEPMFGYAAFRERLTRLERFRMGKIRLTPKELKELVGTSLIYVSPRNWELARDMANAGYGIIYQGTDGWVFNLDLDMEEESKP